MGPGREHRVRRPATPPIWSAPAAERVAMAQFGVANAAGAVVVFVYLSFLSSSLAAEPGSADRYDLLGFLVFMAAAMPAGFVLGRRLAAPVRSWLSEDRPPTPGEQAAVLALVRRLGAIGFGAWLAAAGWFGTINLVEEGWREGGRVATGTLFGGLATSALTIVLVDRSLRPVYARVLAGGLPRAVRTLGVRRRLVVTWAIASGLPLLGIAVAPLGRDAGERTHLIGPAALAVIGLAVGGLMTSVVARSVGDRLEAVRRALARVQEGDVDVHVVVDEGGEVGLLQAGVNAMVAGLRERQHLRDLFGRHVGDEVARQAIERAAGLGGEQRDASVLFVDLVGSSGLAASRPPGEVVEVLNALFGATVRAAATEGGWVNKFEGDGALCVFGAPAEQPDHAARALRAACALRSEVVGLQARHPELDVGIGVSSGPVVAGNVGAEERYEYTVIGDPVNEAARLTELAKQRASRLLASRESVTRARGEAARWQSVDTVVLRGRTRPSEIFEPSS